MLLSGYFPTWAGAAHELPKHCIVLFILAMALHAYARQRHSLKWTVIALGMGFLITVCTGLGLVWSNWASREPASLLSGKEILQRELIGLFELGVWLPFAFVGLLAGWLGL